MVLLLVCWSVRLPPGLAAARPQVQPATGHQPRSGQEQQAPARGAGWLFRFLRLRRLIFLGVRAAGGSDSRCGGRQV